MKDDSVVEQPVDLALARFLEVDIALVDEDLDPQDGDLTPAFPGVDVEAMRWCFVVDLQSGVTQDWPTGHPGGEIGLKVVERGTYTLLDVERRPLVRNVGYVPDDVLPDSGGDYVELRFDDRGQLGFWVEPDLRDFAMDEFGGSDLEYPNDDGGFGADVRNEAASPTPASSGPLTREQLREQRRAERKELRRQRERSETMNALVGRGAAARQARHEFDERLAAEDLREPDHKPGGESE